VELRRRRQRRSSGASMLLLLLLLLPLLPLLMLKGEPAATRPDPPPAVPGLEEEGVEASDEPSDAIESLPGEGSASNHSCGGLGGGGPQDEGVAAPPPSGPVGEGNASGGIGGLCCCCCRCCPCPCPCCCCCCWLFQPGA